MTSRVIKFVMFPVRVEVTDGKIGCSGLPTLDALQARLDAGYVLSELETMRRLCAEYTADAILLSRRSAEYARTAIEGKLVTSFGRTISILDLQKESARFHEAYEIERDKAQALMLEIQELESDNDQIQSMCAGDE